MINQKHAAKTHLPVGLSEEKRKTWKRKSGLIYQTLEIHIKKGLNRTGLESRFIITITSRGQGALACGMDAGSSLAAARCWLRGTAMAGCCWPTCWPFSCCSPSAEPSYPSSTRCCSRSKAFSPTWGHTGWQALSTQGLRCQQCTALLGTNSSIPSMKLKSHWNQCYLKAKLTKKPISKDIW